MHRHPCLPRIRLMELWRASQSFFDIVNISTYNSRVTNGERRIQQSIFVNVISCIHGIHRHPYFSRIQLVEVSGAHQHSFKNYEYINIQPLNDERGGKHRRRPLYPSILLVQAKYRHPCLPRIQPVEVKRAYQHSFKNPEIINFNKRLMNEEASALQSAFARGYHEFREHIATLTSPVFDRWKVEDYINLPSKSRNHPSKSRHHQLQVSSNQ